MRQRGVDQRIHAGRVARKRGHARGMHVQVQQARGVRRPALRAVQGHGLRGVVRRQIERGGGAGLPAGMGVVARQLGALGRIGHQRLALVEVVDDGEVRQLARPCGAQQAADVQVQRGARLGAGEQIGGLLHAVVGEGEFGLHALALVRVQHRQPLVAGIARHDQAGFQRRVQGTHHAGRGARAGHAQQVGVEAAAQAGGGGEHVAGLGRQAAQLLQHQRHHVVGHAFPADAVRVPAPARLGPVQPDEALLVQVLQEAAEEERVAAGLGVAQPGQRLQLGRGPVQRVGQPLHHVLREQRLQPQRAVATMAGVRQHGQVLQQRVALGHLVLAIGADHQQVLEAFVEHHLTQQPAREAVAPLQIVHEHQQRRLGAAQPRQAQLHGADEAVLGLGGAERVAVGRGRPQQGDEFGQRRLRQRRVHAQERPQPLGPDLAFGRRLGQHLADALRQRLHEGRTRRGLAELVELAAGHVALARQQAALHLLHQRGLAHARGAGQHQHARGAARGLFAGLQQLLHFGGAPVEPGGDLEALGKIALGQHQRLQVVRVAQPVADALQVAPQHVMALIARLGLLGQQALDQRAERSGRLRAGGLQGRRQQRQMGVQGAQGVVQRAEGGRARQQFVERGAQGVEVGAVVHVAVHAAGLLGRHGGQGAFEIAQAHRLGALHRDAGRDAEVDQLDEVAARAHDDVAGGHVLVDDVAFVDGVQRVHHRQGDVDRPGRIERPAGAQPFAQGNGAVVGHGDEQHAVVAAERAGADHPLVRHPARELVLQPEPGDLARAQPRAAQQLDHRRHPAGAPAAQHDGTVALVQAGFHRIAGKGPTGAGEVGDGHGAGLVSGGKRRFLHGARRGARS